MNMPNNPAIHHRRSVRLKVYDYSHSELYFVTSCCQNMTCRSGKIANGEMILNDAGQMIDKWCVELSNKFSSIELDAYITMPNHFHAIIVNHSCNAVGTDLCVCPNGMGEQQGAHIGAPLREVVQWFKTMTTNE